MTRARLTANANRVLEARYLRRDRKRHLVESPDELFERVARAVAEAELRLHNAREAARWEREFHDLIASLDFLPNSPTLMNAGTPLGQLSACFVLPVEDSMESIFASVRDAALLQRTGGGTGFAFSHLRPKGDFVASTGGEASGPVSFMRVFDAVTEHIKLGGRRRGANMGVLRADHPDILEFIHAKLDGGITNFNLSVACTDAFISAVRDDDVQPLVHPRSHLHAGDLRAQDVFAAIVDAAWRTGDPGLLFLEAIERNNPVPDLGRIEATNPCGEVPLMPYEACNLGSINLAHMLKEARGKAEIDWEKLGATARRAVRFLDDVIEVNRFQLPAIDDMARRTRKIGLGVMGFAEMLIRLGVSYDSDEACALAERIAHAIDEASLQASQALAEERGVFPSWDLSTHKERGVKVRHASRTAIAPTGTLSILAGTTPSIEPLFALAYRRTNILGGQTLYEESPLFASHLERHGLDKDRIVAEVAKKGGLRDVEGVPEELRRLFVTALEIPAERHLEIQAAFQRHVDNSVSKTINLPEDATREDVSTAYLRAWEFGLKGITIYRYGSRGAQVMELGAEEEPAFRDHSSRCDLQTCRL